MHASPFFSLNYYIPAMNTGRSMNIYTYIPAPFSRESAFFMNTHFSHACISIFQFELLYTRNEYGTVDEYRYILTSFSRESAFFMNTHFPVHPHYFEFHQYRFHVHQHFLRQPKKLHFTTHSIETGGEESQTAKKRSGVFAQHLRFAAVQMERRST